MGLQVKFSRQPDVHVCRSVVDTLADAFAAGGLESARLPDIGPALALSGHNRDMFEELEAHPRRGLQARLSFGDGLAREQLPAVFRVKRLLVASARGDVHAPPFVWAVSPIEPADQVRVREVRVVHGF